MAEIGYGFPEPETTPNRSEIFTADGVFEVKQNVSVYYLTLIGGGGGGGNAVSSSASHAAATGGGRGDMVSDYPVTVTPGGVIYVTVGSGGGSVTAGGSTSFGSYLSVNGGAAGTSATNTINGWSQSQGRGHGYTDGTNGIGGSGGDGLLGSGGAGAVRGISNGATNGSAGTGYGSGGGGGVAYNDGAATGFGGSGTGGIVIVRW